MAIPKYARMEHERRFLVSQAPDLAGAPARLIEDLYIDGGRLRLRAVTDLASGERTFKLCKKYGPADGEGEPIANLYLTAEEHAVLARLPGDALRKRRYTVDGVSLDVFEGPLDGLMIAEAEAESHAAIAARAFPPWCGREVTGDRRYSGATLAFGSTLASPKPG
ncbi:MAG: hypothetical protein ACK4YQ_16560 [Phenylobacterium sp.]|uniref:hypothetical protein n=1 Tax=Phenylobacterium sp. TaxID=1871053 RepID=UPI00391A02C5